MMLWKISPAEVNQTELQSSATAAKVGLAGAVDPKPFILGVIVICHCNSVTAIKHLVKCGIKI